MTIESDLNQALKDAMRSKDKQTADCIRMLKTKHMERRTASGFSGELNDELWLDVIGAYQKQLKKSREEYVAAGDRGADVIPGLDFEIAFCAKFLPQLAGEDEVRTAVKAALAESGVTDPKQSGRVMGAIMKDNKGKFDPAMVKRILGEELG
jgi:uncharacterized protein YqeY